MDRALHVDKRYDEYRQKVHLEKIAIMKPAVDVSKPQTFSHLENKKKKQQMQIETHSKADYENRVMLKKIAEITRKPSAIDNHNPDFAKYKRSLNKEKRQRDLDKITSENMAFVKRMVENQPTHTQTSWEDVREKQMKYLKNSSQYPVLESKKSSPTPTSKAPQKVIVSLAVRPLKIDSGTVSISPPMKKGSKPVPLNLSGPKKAAVAKKEDFEDDDDFDSEEEEGEESMDITDSDEDN